MPESLMDDGTRLKGVKMKKIALAVALTFVSVGARAGWISTYYAYSAAEDADKANRASQSAVAQIQSLQKQMNELKAIVLKMAEALDKEQAEKPVAKKKSAAKAAKKTP